MWKIENLVSGEVIVLERYDIEGESDLRIAPERMNARSSTITPLTGASRVAQRSKRRSVQIRAPYPS